MKLKQIVLKAVMVAVVAGAMLAVPVTVSAKDAGSGAVAGTTAGSGIGGIDANGDGIPDRIPDPSGESIKQGYPIIAASADSDTWEATIQNSIVDYSFMNNGNQITIPYKSHLIQYWISFSLIII